ncbi:hypothetical protein BHE74_00005987 [Ensete ventricosum]|nr:hypothetical protein BHE74_00005987 [Ensete ventricosum]
MMAERDGSEDGVEKVLSAAFEMRRPTTYPSFNPESMPHAGPAKDTHVSIAVCCTVCVNIYNFKPFTIAFLSERETSFTCSLTLFDAPVVDLHRGKWGPNHGNRKGSLSKPKLTKGYERICLVKGLLHVTWHVDNDDDIDRGIVKRHGVEDIRIVAHVEINLVPNEIVRVQVYDILLCHEKGGLPSSKEPGVYGAQWEDSLDIREGPKSSIDRAKGGGGKMRLLTHNMLSCNIKGVANGFPLRLEAEKWVEKEVELNADFLRHIFPKIEWKALAGAARAVGYCELPEEADAAMLDSEDFLRRFHHALLEIHVEEGALFCPETGRRFSITKGIPNMLLREDEV